MINWSLSPLPTANFGPDTLLFVHGLMLLMQLPFNCFLYAQVDIYSKSRGLGLLRNYFFCFSRTHVPQLVSYLIEEEDSFLRPPATQSRPWYLNPLPRRGISPFMNEWKTMASSNIRTTTHPSQQVFNHSENETSSRKCLGVELVEVWWNPEASCGSSSLFFVSDRKSASMLV